MKIQKKWIMIVSTLVILAGLFVYFALSQGEADEGQQAVEMEEQRRTGERPSSWSGGSGRNLGRSAMDQFIQESEVATPEILMMQYRLYYRYPPHSRPLTRKMSDLLDPFSVKEEKNPYPAPDGSGKIALYYSWTSPTYMITGTQPAVGTLEITDPETGARVQPRILSAEMYSDSVFGERLIGTVDYNDSGVAPDAEAKDGIYTFRWQPRSGERLHWGDLSMRVRFDAPNLSGAELNMGFTSTPAIPARFTGNYRERMEKGSLILSVDIDVQKPGEYIIEGNLFGQDDEKPYHWVYLKPYLERGAQTLDLEFFGTIFHDREFEEGRLVLRNLRGHRLNLPYDPRKLDDMLARNEEIPETHEPLQEWMAPVERDLPTRQVYNIRQFSTDEYEGPDKAERLRVIQEYARDWEEAHGAGPETNVDD